MKRTKKWELNLDVSNNHQPTQPGFKRIRFTKLGAFKQVDAVLMNGVLEQLTNPQRVEFMRTLYKSLKVGGKAVCIVSDWSNPEAYMSPFSEWPPLCPEWFGFFSKDVRKRSEYSDDRLDDINFDVGWVELYAPEWKDRSDKAKEFAARHYINVKKGITMTLIKKEK